MRRLARINSSRRANWAAFLAIAAVYLLLFIPPNRTGARDPNMLAVFVIEEFAQYPYLMHMTTPGDSWGETLRNLIVYQHYYYGYPFYLLSAAAILPGKLLLHATESLRPQATTLNMVVLRQLSPLFVLGGVGLLVYCWTVFRHLLRTLLLLTLLLTVPAVIMHNTWWHAESLTLFFVSLTIFALWRDDLRFGRWFYAAAIACGLAAGIKLVGFWFFLTIAVYLLIGLRHHRLSTVAKCGLFFVFVMGATILLTNPLLLVAGTRQTIIDTLSRQADRMTFGWDVRMTKGPVPWYTETLRANFGFWWFYALAFAATLYGVMATGDKRLLGIIILTFVLPFTIYLLFFVAAKVPRYFLPLAIPLFSCFGHPGLYRFERQRPIAAAASALLVAAIAIQIVFFIDTDRAVYRDTLHRETNSPSLAFYRLVDEAFLSQQPAGPSVVIYRDPRLYVPPDARFDNRFTWNAIDYDAIRAINPRLILVRQTSIDRFADPRIIDEAYDQAAARRAHAFAIDAQRDAIDGYRRILETDYASAYLRTD